MVFINDLQLGDIVVCNNGDAFIYVDTPYGKRFLYNNGWLDINNFSDTLQHRFSSGYSISKIYRPVDCYKLTYSDYPYSLKRITGTGEYTKLNYPFETVIKHHSLSVIHRGNFINLKYVLEKKSYLG